MQNFFLPNQVQILSCNSKIIKWDVIQLGIFAFYCRTMSCLESFMYQKNTTYEHAVLSVFIFIMSFILQTTMI